ncbi:MAG: hypothetical protein ABJE95_09650 [Byssovorax sp.]
MARNDELDRSLARQFAWGLTPQGVIDGAPPATDEPTVELEWTSEDGEIESEIEIEIEIEIENGSESEGESASDGGEGSLDDWRAESREICGLLADGILRVWAMTDPAKQAEATAALVLRAAELGLGAVGMKDHPLESIRLLRLMARHRERLPPRAQEASLAAAPWLDFSHPEVAELVLDQARAGDRSLELSMMLAFGFGEDRETMPQPPRFGERLAEIIDGGATFRARTAAIRAVRYVEGAAVVPALRRALRAPHAVVRWLALSSLERSFPDAVLAEDVLFLLEDAVLHPLPTSLGGVEDVARALAYYPDLIEKAAARVRPPGGEKPLERILTYDCVEQGFRWSLDASWALGVLAAAYPDRGEVLIDQRLSDPSTKDRAAAARAAGSLPVERARPRLLRAASDGAPDVSEAAREHWMRLFGTSCPADEIAPFAHLLDSAPSERLRGRVLGLRGPPQARQKLASVLLAEAPDPEALVGLLIALSDRAAFSWLKIEGMPEDCAAWVAALTRAFGSRGVDGLCLLASRNESEVEFGWFGDLAAAIEKGVFAEGDFPKLRAVAVARVADVAFGASHAAIDILIKTGFPPELHDRLWALVWAANESWIISYGASKALGCWGDRARLEAEVIAAMRAAIAADEPEKVMVAAQIGLEQAFDGAAALTLQAFESATKRPAVDEDFCQALCFRAQDLVNAGSLDPGWVYQALAAPETCRFTVAAELVPHRIILKKAPPEARRHLLRALDSTVRGGAAAAEAAKALLDANAIGVRNPRLAAVFARAPLAARVPLLGTFLFREVPLGARVWEAIEEMLVSADPAVLALLREGVSLLPWRRHTKRLLELYPRVVDAHLRWEFRMHLRALRGDADYWEDSESDE